MSVAFDAPALPTLIAASKTLVATPRRMDWLVPHAADLPVKVLRDALHQHGYVWLKGLLDPAEVIAFRRYALSHLADAGFLDRAADPGLGIASGDPGNTALSNRLLMELVRSAAYESFCVQPRLWRFMDQLLEGTAYLHKRKLLRHTLPQTQQVTPAHYDLIYLRGGTDRIVTAWIPVGDIPVEMGGLTYLEGSHALGLRLEGEFRQESADLTPEEQINAYNKHMTEGGWISKDLPDMAEKFDTRWLVADYEAGDVVLHSPYMIHASTTNTDRQRRIRLSTDIRYQNVRDEIDARWANHWTMDDML